MSVNNVNPSTIFGGSWVRYAEGRALIGVSGTGQSQVVSGAATANLPAHLHTQTVHAHGMAHHHAQTVHAHGVGAHTHALNDSGSAGANPVSTYMYVRRVNRSFQANHRGNMGGQGARSGDANPSLGLVGATGAMSAATNTVNSAAVNTGGSSTANTANSAAANTGNPTTTPTISTIQPSITCFIWRRTA